MMIRGAIFGTITDGRELLACSIDTDSIDNIDSSSSAPLREQQERDRRSCGMHNRIWVYACSRLVRSIKKS